MPQRIQMTRQRPWRAEYPDAVIVDRRTTWGNPFRVEKSTPARNWFVDDPRHGPHDHIVADSAEAVELFRELVARKGWFLVRAYGKPDGELLWAGPMWQSWEPSDRLGGRDLACWCPLDQPCHADVLLELANANDPAVTS